MRQSFVIQDLKRQVFIDRCFTGARDALHADVFSAVQSLWCTHHLADWSGYVEVSVPPEVLAAKVQATLGFGLADVEGAAGDDGLVWTGAPGEASAWYSGVDFEVKVRGGGGRALLSTFVLAAAALCRHTHSPPAILTSMDALWVVVCVCVWWILPVTYVPPSPHPPFALRFPPWSQTGVSVDVGYKLHIDLLPELLDRIPRLPYRPLAAVTCCASLLRVAPRS